MDDFSKVIEAYALHNALEYGRADAGRILPKLFQHGLDKKDIPEIMPLITDIVDKINSLRKSDMEKLFDNFKDIVKKKEEKEKDLPEIDVSDIGKVVTRMAPEPSKYAHLGHAMTFLINYLYAQRYGGKCLLRLEDTNPEKVSQEYADAIIEDIRDYLGIKFSEVRYVSDDMPFLIDYAEKLVKSEHAFICTCEREKMQDLRHKGIECGCRHLPLKMQLERWKEFHTGKYNVGEAVLRLKGNMQSENHVMRDPALFRRMDAKHYRHGMKYKIWPLYDFYNPIEDSIMGVNLILRSNEFDTRVELQDKLKDLLNLKKQKIIQYGRFNVADFTTKGREIREMFQTGELLGWDDPRLITLRALKRRGITREAIYELVKQVGLSKHPVNLEFDMIAAINRKIIDGTSMRYYFVPSPASVKLEGDLPEKINVPVHPERKEVRVVKVTPEIFIPGSDIENLNGKEIRLLHLCNIHLNKDIGTITGFENKNVPKIQWVSNDGVKARVLMPDGKWLEGMAESAIGKLKPGQIIQFERFGFVRFDGVKDKVPEFWFAHK